MALVRRPATRATQGGNLTRYSGFPTVFDEMDQMLQRLMPSMGDFGGLTSDYPIDLYETSEALVLEMAIPGVKSDQLDISLEGRQLTIQGNFTLPEGEERRYWVQNIARGQFSRTITLPTAVEPDTIKAQVHDGLLTLTLPKVAEARARKITIEAH